MEKFQMQKSYSGFGRGGDDAFEVPVSSYESLVISSDSYVEGTHFTLSMPLQSTGWKTVVGSLSDIYAMGADPSFCSLNLILPPSFSEENLGELLEGVFQASQKYSIRLLGGDIARGSSLSLVCTVGGYKAKSQIKRNHQALAGDYILTAAPLGEALLGYELFKSLTDEKLLSNKENQNSLFSEEESFFVNRFFYPDPPKKLARFLSSKTSVGALLDISDGLKKELENLSLINQLSLEILDLPVSLKFKKVAETQGLDPLVLALKGGEEYQLLWTVREKELKAFMQDYAKAFGAEPAIIGRCFKVDSGEPFIKYKDQELLDSVKSFSHF